MYIYIYREREREILYDLLDAEVGLEVVDARQPVAAEPTRQTCVHCVHIHQLIFTVSK